MILDGININELLDKNQKIIILGHECPDVDSIVSGYLLEKCLLKSGYEAKFYILDKEINKETLEILKKYNFDASYYQNNFFEDEANAYFLVDHNERNINGEIIGIIDHHPTSKKIDIECYFNNPISSTALYICKENENLLNKEDIELAIVATMLDTCSFNSTKGRDEDKKWVINKCNELGLDYNELYKDGIYCTPIIDLNKSSLNGLKKYNYNGKKVESSYVHIDNYDSNKEKINQIIDILREYKNINDLVMFVFIVHDMEKLKTRVYKIGNTIQEVKYDRYTSRGNDIMPSIEKELTR